MMPVPYHGCTCHLRYAAAKEHAAAVASNRKQVIPESVSNKKKLKTFISEGVSYVENFNVESKMSL